MILAVAEPASYVLFRPPKRLAFGTPASKRSNPRMAARFINKDQVINIQLLACFLKLCTLLDNITTALQRCYWSLFLCVNPSLCMARRIVERCTRLERNI